MLGMFARYSLISLTDISKWNISKVSDIRQLFYDCKSLFYLPDISKWDTSNVTKIESIFKGPSSLS